MLDEKTLMKVARIATQGEPGERTVAMNILSSHGVANPYDLLERENKVLAVIPFKDVRERRIIFQCYFFITGDTEVTYIRHRGRKVSIEILESLKQSFESFTHKVVALWREELDRFEAAFILRNGLHSDSDNDDDKPCRLSRKEIEKIMAMAAGMTPIAHYPELKA